MPATCSTHPKFPGGRGSDFRPTDPASLTGSLFHSNYHSNRTPSRPSNDLPILHMQDPVAHPGQLLVVGHDQKGLLELLTKL